MLSRLNGWLSLLRFKPCVKIPTKIKPKTGNLPLLLLVLFFSLFAFIVSLLLLFACNPYQPGDKTMRSFLQHHLNELHIFCRLRSVGCPVQVAQYIAQTIGKLVNRFLY